MKKFRFILLCATIGVMTAGLTGCTKSVFDEKQALEAQKDLLQFKYGEETKLELLRQSGQLSYLTTSQNLQYTFSVRTNLFYDSLQKANQENWNNIYYRKRDIVLRVLDLVTSEPIIGAEVTIPTTVGTVIKVKTDSSGRAFFAQNVNIPNPASAMATKEGYAAGSVFATIAGSNSAGASETIRIWNLKNATNTVKGKVYIENDLTNDAPEVAKKTLINAFTFVNTNGYSQRFDFAATTDDNGEYSIKVPNLSTPLEIAYTALEGSSKMYVNSFVPGADSIPSLKSINATYFLGTATVNPDAGSGYSLTNQIEYPDLTLSGFTIPTTVDRYHVSAVADSNGRAHFIKSITFGNSTLATSATLDTAFLTGTYNYTAANISQNRTSAANYSSNTTIEGGRYTSRYLAGTKVRDTIAATLYDVLANADGYWKTAPILNIVLTMDSTTAIPTGSKYKYISGLIQKTGGKVIKPDNNFTHVTLLKNLIKTTSNINSASYNTSTLNDGFTEISTSSLNNGKTYTLDLSFGTGKLKIAVR